MYYRWLTRRLICDKMYYMKTKTMVALASFLMVCMPERGALAQSTQPDLNVSDRGGGIEALTPFQRLALSVWNGEEPRREGCEGRTVASGPTSRMWMVRRENQATSRGTRLPGRNLQRDARARTLGNEVRIPTPLGAAGLREMLQRGGSGYNTMWCMETGSEAGYCFSVSR